MAKRTSDSRFLEKKKSTGASLVGGGSGVPKEGGVPARLAEFGCDPFAIMAEIAMDETADARLRFSAAKELAAYLAIKPRQTMAGPDGFVDVAEIIASAWRHSPDGKHGAAKPTIPKRPDGKATKANTKDTP